MDYDSYDSASEVGYSEVSSDNGDYGFDGGSDEQPRARQARVELESCIALFSCCIKLQQPLHQTADRGSCCCTCRADHSQRQCTSAKAGMPCKMVARSRQVKQAGLAIPTVQSMSGQIAQ